MKEIYDLIVIGAGPAGLGAAINAVRHNQKVLVIEAADQIAPARRGETIRYSKNMEALLYPGFFDGQTLHSLYHRRYYSHSCSNYADKEIENPNRIIHFTHFVQAIADYARERGVIIRTAEKAEEVIIENSAVGGLKTDKNEYQTRLLFNCSGHRSDIKNIERTEKAAVNIPIYKEIVSGFNGPDDRLQYFLHVAGEESLPAVGCIFPRGSSEAEVIITIWSDVFPDRAQGMTLDSDAVLLFAEKFRSEHPLFGEQLQNTETEYALNSFIPMGKRRKQIMSLPGLVNAGDSAGHVEARGGSGIRSSFLIAADLTELALKTEQNWQQGNINSFNRQVNSLPEIERLSEFELKYRLPRRTLFKTVTSSWAMDLIWPGLRLMFS